MAPVTPAFAAVPTVDSFTPTNGIVGDAVVLTGTGFTGATNVTFNGAEATFTIDSDVQISTSVPVGATTGPIAVTTPDGTGPSATDFVVIVRPTITTFDPAAGPAGTIVTLTGTHFTAVTSVTFNDVPSPDFTVVSDTLITAEVPSGAGTGPIRVTNAAGTRRSDQDFKFQKIEHRTTATLKLSGHLVATGQVRIPDGFTRCMVHRTVLIQRRDSDPTWPKLRKGETRRDGSYRINLPDREGRYRAFVKRMHLTDDICEAANSDRKTHEHRTTGGGGGGGLPSSKARLGSVGAKPGENRDAVHAAAIDAGSDTSGAR